MMADDVENTDIAIIAQTEAWAFMAGERKGKAKGKGRGKGKNFRTKYSTSLKPKLSLEDRKKALE